MARDAELDRLKVAQDVAFQRKQNAYQAQQTACAKAFQARLEELKSTSRKRSESKSQSPPGLAFRFNTKTMSGFRKSQMVISISTSVGLVSLMVLGMGTTLWISMEP